MIEMNVQGLIAVCVLAVAIAGHAITSFFKTPKETSSDLTRRVDTLERETHTRFQLVGDEHDALARHSIEAWTRLTEAVTYMRATMGEMSAELKELNKVLRTPRRG